MIDIIPAIDLIYGKCVRLSQGDFAQKKTYDTKPLDIALQYESCGIRRLHMVDLDGARYGSPKNLHILEQVAQRTNLMIDYGGGIRTSEDVQAVYAAGAAMINISSIVIKQPHTVDEWAAAYGADKILIGADVSGEHIAIAGWEEKTGINIHSFIAQCVAKGLCHIFCTDIQQDGMLSGPSIVLYDRIIAHAPQVSLIASGGIASMQDIYALEAAGCTGAIIGKALYEGKITLTQLEKYITNGTR